MNKVLGGGTIDGSLGVNPAWLTYNISLGRTIQALNSNLEVEYYNIQETLSVGGYELANGLFANPTHIAVEAAVNSVNSRIGDVVLNKADVNLSEVDNTSDLDKPMSNATSNAINTVVSTTETEINRVRILALAGL